MKNKIKNLFKILVVTAGCLMFASFSPSLDGRAVVVDDGVFPQGLFAKTVGYLPGDIISVTNIAGDATVDILVIGALDPSEGVAIMLSPEAAQAMGIEKGSNNIVKITKRSGQEERVYGNAVISKSASDFDDKDDGSFETIGAEENSEAFEEPAAEENPETETFEEETEEFTETAESAEPAEPAEETLAEEPEIEEETEEAFEDTEAEETAAPEETTEPEEEAAPEEAIESEEIAEEAFEEEPLEEEAFEEEPAAEEEAPVEETPVEETAEEEAFEEESIPEEAPEEEAAEEEAFEDEPLEDQPEEKEYEAVEEEELPEHEDAPEAEEFEEEELEETPETPEETVTPEEEETEEAPAEEAFAADDLDELPAEETPAEEAAAEEEEYEAIVLVPADSNPPEPAETEEDEVEDVVAEDELESLDEEDVYNLIPLEGGSSSSSEVGATGAPVEAAVEAVAVEPEPAPVVETTTSYDKYLVPSLKDLESGKYYIQIAVYASDENILEVINKYGNNYPITLVPMAGGNKKQVLIGPVTMDEYKVVLERFKSYGFKDAFLRKVR